MEENQFTCEPGRPPPQRLVVSRVLYYISLEYGAPEQICPCRPRLVTENVKR